MRGCANFSNKNCVGVSNFQGCLFSCDTGEPGLTFGNPAHIGFDPDYELSNKTPDIRSLAIELEVKIEQFRLCYMSQSRPSSYPDPEHGFLLLLLLGNT